ncbi:hypothetical protein acdb102_10440 [Acidothermaceae bacterium B102]|nr:hypothetical protein acdb102_10440 [Acidothermaceae bacterium B102]
MHTFAWWDHPEAFNARAADALTLPTRLTTARPCPLADLRVVALVGAAGGSVGMALRFRNESATACELRGVPDVALVAADGTVWQSTARTVRTDKAAAVVLVPGSWAESNPWMVGSSCGGAGVTTVVSVSLPGQSAVRRIEQRLGGPWSRDCGSAAGPPTPSPGQLRGRPIAAIDAPSLGGVFLGLTLLEGALAVPGQVRRGSVLHYRLVLTANGRDGGAMDGGQPQDGTLCPLYDVRLGSAGGTYELRCDVPVILAQAQSVAYDLVLTVPPDAPLGPTTLTWQFLEPALPALTAQVSVV